MSTADARPIRPMILNSHRISLLLEMLLIMLAYRSAHAKQFLRMF